MYFSCGRSFSLGRATPRYTNSTLLLWIDALVTQIIMEKLSALIDCGSEKKASATFTVAFWGVQILIAIAREGIETRL